MENTSPQAEISQEQYLSSVERILECAPYNVADIKEPTWYGVTYRISDYQYITIDVPTMPELMRVHDDPEDDLFFDVSDVLAVIIETLQDTLDDGTIIVKKESFSFNLNDQTTSYEEVYNVFDSSGNLIKPPRPDLDTEEGMHAFLQQINDEYNFGTHKLTEQRLNRLMSVLDQI